MFVLSFPRVVKIGRKHAFSRVLEMVKEIDAMGMETCTTLGMVTDEQAEALRDAGLTAWVCSFV